MKGFKRETIKIRFNEKGDCFDQSGYSYIDEEGEKMFVYFDKSRGVWKPTHYATGLWLGNTAPNKEYAKKHARSFINSELKKINKTWEEHKSKWVIINL